MSISHNEKNGNYIGIDLGTTHIKSAVFDEQGNLLEIQKAATPIIKDDFGHIYDPQQIYGIILDQIAYLLKRYKKINGISITGMAEAGLIINRRKLIEETPILPWFDQRTEILAKQVSKDQEEINFYKTGLRNSYKYGIYKYLWLLSYYNIQKEDSIWLSICDYIVWKLTGQFVSDPSFAARTYVYDIILHCWDEKRLMEYGLSKNNFPTVISSGEAIGYLTDKNLLLSQKEPITICIGGHDHVCAAYAVLNNNMERICNSVGTAETYLGVDTGENFQLTESHYNSGMVYGPFINGKDYFWMGNISSSGQSVEWFRKKIQKDEISYSDMNEMISALSEEPTDILYYPYLSGIGTPFFLPEVSSSFIGLRESHNEIDLLKAILEGINYQGKWILSLVPGKELTEIKDVVCVGGATNSTPWMQIKANILGIPVIVPYVTEATLLGAVAIMIDKKYGSKERQKLLTESQKQNHIFKVNEKINKMYQEIYTNKYTFLIEMIIKQELGRKDRGNI